MATKAVNVDPALSAASQALLLVWQDPESRTFHRVGRLTRDSDGQFAFEYVDGALGIEGFDQLMQFPKTDGPSEFGALPPFFQNRILSAERENYGEYLSWIGLAPSEENLPMEFLARTGGSRATDTFHLVQEPPIGDGLYSRFFVSGLRHLDIDGALVKSLSVGDELSLSTDDAFPRDPAPLLLLCPTGEKVGYLPDWLVNELHQLTEQGKQLTVRIEQINLDAPHHLRLLCRIEISVA